MLEKNFFKYFNKSLNYATDDELKAIYQSVKAQRDYRRILKVKVG